MQYNIRVCLAMNGSFIDKFVMDSDELNACRSVFTLEQALDFTRKALLRPEFMEIKIVRAS